MTSEMHDPVHALEEKLRALSRAVSGFRPSWPITKTDLNELENRIMSRLSELEAQNAAVSAEILDAVTGVTEEVKATHEAVKELDKMIEKLQNSPGVWTPEDQAAFDRIQAKNKEILTNVKALRDTTQALREDAATPPTPAPEGTPHQG